MVILVRDMVTQKLAIRLTTYEKLLFLLTLAVWTNSLSLDFTFLIRQKSNTQLITSFFNNYQMFLPCIDYTGNLR